MRVRFWGTRGSLAKPGRDTVRFGGNTSCVQIVADSGTQLVLDCGTGAHGLGRHLLSECTESVSGALLLSHTHWDHIQGIPFFAPFFLPDQQWDIYAPRGLASSLDETLAGQMQYTYFPVKLDQLGARIRFHELVEGRFEIGDVTVTARYLNHPCITLGYRIEVDNAVAVYACDHEPIGRQPETGLPEVRESEARHIEFLRGADLVIHDAQYRASEYAAKRGWGHSTIEYSIAVCREAGVRHLVFTHHDPIRTDADIEHDLETLDLLHDCASDDLRVTAAAEGDVIELRNTAPSDTADTDVHTDALTEAAAEVHTVVVVAPPGGAVADTITAAAEAEGLEVQQACTAADLRELAAASRAVIVALVHDDSGSRGADVMLATARELADSPHATVLVASEHGELLARENGLEPLVWPFSEEYARARLTASAMRTTLRWLRARRPDDEPARLDALHQLGILDSEPEERFDLLAKVAADALAAPIALVSLVDRERQWFKACIGLGERETPRDFAFCAHAVAARELLVVPDALIDERFADNPLVTGPPRVRFYAGVPLSLPDGFLVGTLCVIDVRARQLGEPERSLLCNIARLVEVELARPAAA